MLNGTDIPDNLFLRNLSPVMIVRQRVLTTSICIGHIRQQNCPTYHCHQIESKYQVFPIVGCNKPMMTVAPIMIAQ